MLRYHFFRDITVLTVVTLLLFSSGNCSGTPEQDSDSSSSRILPAATWVSVADSRLESHLTSYRFPTRRYGANLALAVVPAGRSVAEEQYRKDYARRDPQDQSFRRSGNSSLRFAAGNWPSFSNLKDMVLILSGGYNYDHPTHSPLWLSDSWEFSFTTGLWRRLDPPGAAEYLSFSGRPDEVDATRKRKEMRMKQKSAELVNYGVDDSPRGVYKSSFVSYKGTHFVHFGGDDGGHLTAKGQETHVWGSFSNALRLFYLEDFEGTYRWKLLDAGSGIGGIMKEERSSNEGAVKWKIRPAPRQSHTAEVMGNRMFLFGGLSASEPTHLDNRYLKDMNDLWTLALDELEVLTDLPGAEDAKKDGNSPWVQLESSEEHPNVQTTEELGGGKSRVAGAAREKLTNLLRPVPRRSHTSCADPSGEKFYIFGGFSMGDDWKNLNDVWEYQILPSSGDKTGKEENTRRWTNLSPQDDSHFDLAELKRTRGKGIRSSPTVPNPRGGHAMALDAVSRTIYITGGATCVMACFTYTDVYAFSLRTKSWKLVLENKEGFSASGTVGQQQPVRRHYASYASVSSLFASPLVAKLEGSSSQYYSLPLEGQPLMIYFGGESYNPYGYWNDVWALVRGSREGLADAIGGRVGGEPADDRKEVVQQQWWEKFPSLTSPGPEPSYYDEKPGMLDNLMFTTIPDAGVGDGHGHGKWWTKKKRGGEGGLPDEDEIQDRLGGEDLDPSFLSTFNMTIFLLGGIVLVGTYVFWRRRKTARMRAARRVTPRGGRSISSV